MILDDFAVTDEVAIVTGAGLGIGRSIAIGLAEAGADVVVAARTTSDLAQVVARIEETGWRALAVQADVMKSDLVERHPHAASRNARRHCLCRPVPGVPGIVLGHRCDPERRWRVQRPCHPASRSSPRTTNE